MANNLEINNKKSNSTLKGASIVGLGILAALSFPIIGAYSGATLAIYATSSATGLAALTTIPYIMGGIIGGFSIGTIVGQVTAFKALLTGARIINPKYNERKSKMKNDSKNINTPISKIQKLESVFTVNADKKLVMHWAKTPKIKQPQLK